MGTIPENITQAVGELLMLRNEPGFQMRWQHAIDHVIVVLTQPVEEPKPVEEAKPVEPEAAVEAEPAPVEAEPVEEDEPLSEDEYSAYSRSKKKGK